MAANGFDDDQTRSFTQVAAGTKVSHYKIISKIGAGGMGEVYLAEDTQLDRKVALKFLLTHLSQTEASRARFAREAKAAAKLDHPNIVPVYEVSSFRERPFFAMAHIEGQSFRQVIKQGKLSISETVDLTIQICEGLKEAHNAGVVHRDIKPGNIIIDKKGKPHLLDFGLAMVSDEEKLTQTGSTMGTVGYMSPEMVRGEPIDARGDIFSLGVIFYELITGMQPFRRESDAATLHAIAYESPVSMAILCPDVPEAIERFIKRAMEKDRNDRYQKIDDMMADLETVQSSLEVGIQLPKAKAPSLLRTLRLKRTAATYFTIAIIILIVFVSSGSRRTILGWFDKDPVPDQLHLAVLPFSDFGEPVFGQSFSNGLIETLSSKLTQMEQFHGSLWVVPASEVREQRVSSADQARRLFGVNLAVSGSIQRLGDNARLTLNLVDTKSKRQLRSFVIDHSLANLTALQDTIVVVLAEMLEVHLRPRDHRILTAGGTASPTAYSFYLQARGHLKFQEDKECSECIDSAIDLFNYAIERDAEYALAFAGLGEAYWRKYNLSRDIQWVDPAISSSQVALELSDKLAPVYITLGMIHQGTGRYDDAVRYYQHSLKIDPANRSAYSGLAQAFESLGDLNQAESTYFRAIELAPDRWRGYYDLALSYLYRGRNEDALEQLATAESLAPDAVSPLNDLGGLYLYLGHREEARLLLERSLELEPVYSAYSNLGVIHQLEKRNEKAAEMYERALEFDDGDYRVWINLASIYEEIPGRNEKALSAYRVAIPLAEEQLTINPNDPFLLCHLASSYGAIGERAKSLSSARKAVELAPDNVEIMIRVGIVYEISGMRDEALALIGRAVEHGVVIAEIENYYELHDLLADPRFASRLAEE